MDQADLRLAPQQLRPARTLRAGIRPRVDRARNLSAATRRPLARLDVFHHRFVCLGISSLYELFDWTTALASGSGAIEFLATQGDVWDTQEDMCTALVGAICALLFFARWHDRQLRKLPNDE